jgi:hypothetical protein
MKPGLFIATLFLSASLAYAQDSRVTLTSPPVAENQNAPEITFAVDEYNFGTIKQGDSVAHTFTFTNTGKEPLIISSASATCGCTVPNWPKEPILKGKTGEIKVIFRSAGKVGIQDKAVTIQSNAKNNPAVVHMKGTVEVAKQAADQTTPVKQDNQAAPLEIKSK